LLFAAAIDRGFPRLQIDGVIAFAGFPQVVLHTLSWIQGLVTFLLYVRVVYEQVVTALVGPHEPIAFGVVKPFDSSCCHLILPSLGAGCDCCFAVRRNVSAGWFLSNCSSRPAGCQVTMPR